nr:reverse transcriptase domain-containing protein [Tanacetum cinerariifolium]
MTKEDEDKTTFFAGKGVFCYQKMPFVLKNAGATYQSSVGDERMTTSGIVTIKENSKLDNMWKLYTDEASSFDGSRVGLMLISPRGKEYMYALRVEFETTNNEAEYEALLV